MNSSGKVDPQVLGTPKITGLGPPMLVGLYLVSKPLNRSKLVSSNIIGLIANNLTAHLLGALHEELELLLEEQRKGFIPWLCILGHTAP